MSESKVASPPSITPPREGDHITPGASESYVKLASAERQASMWNEQLRLDAVCGPASGFIVGVGPRMDGRHPLVWVRSADRTGRGLTSDQ